MAIDNRWRKELYTKIRRQLQFLRERKIVFPETLVMPTGAKGNVFEFGGQDHASGMAMIVAAPSGKPTHSRILRRRWANELHAAMQVWPGCLVAVGYHSMGKEAMALYAVVKVSITNDKTFGTVELRQLASKVGNSNENKYWYEIEGIPGVHDMMDALKEKLYWYGCTEPVFVEWFHDIKKADKYALLRACEHNYESNGLVQDPKGIGDSGIEEEAICNDFEQFMFSVKKIADDLNENYRQRFVWVQFGYYLKSNGSLVCQARLLTNEHGAQFPVVAHPTIYVVEIKEVETIREYMTKFNPDFQRVLFGVPSFDILWKGILSDPENTMVNFTKYAKCTSRPSLPQDVAPASAIRGKTTTAAHLDEVLVAPSTTEDQNDFDDQPDDSGNELLDGTSEPSTLYKRFYIALTKEETETREFKIEKIVMQKSEGEESSLIEIEGNLSFSPHNESVIHRIEAKTADARMDIFDISHSLVPTEENPDEFIFCINCSHFTETDETPVDENIIIPEIKYLGFTLQQ